jgi:hypothetical protein
MIRAPSAQKPWDGGGLPRRTPDALRAGAELWHVVPGTGPHTPLAGGERPWCRSRRPVGRVPGSAVSPGHLRARLICAPSTVARRMPAEIRTYLGTTSLLSLRRLLVRGMSMGTRWSRHPPIRRGSLSVGRTFLGTLTFWQTALLATSERASASPASRTMQPAATLSSVHLSRPDIPHLGNMSAIGASMASTMAGDRGGAGARGPTTVHKVAWWWTDDTSGRSQTRRSSSCRCGPCDGRRELMSRGQPLRTGAATHYSCGLRIASRIRCPSWRRPSLAALQRVVARVPQGHTVRSALEAHIPGIQDPPLAFAGGYGAGTPC